MDSLTPNSIALVDDGYTSVIDDICALNWAAIDQHDLTLVAWAYYYFSIQFRENLEIAHKMHPNDAMLSMLVQEECNTANLSPWPDVVVAGEKANHDEFMRRSLMLSPIDPSEQNRAEIIGQDYLSLMRDQPDLARAMSIASFEDGGLERVFTAILQAKHWEATPLLAAFRHFLVKHIEFDGGDDGGHGALARHLAPDERIRPLWLGFYRLFVDTVPRLKG